MNKLNTLYQSEEILSGKNRQLWRILQVATLSLGIGLVYTLLFREQLGLHLLWDVLIPIAPLLFLLGVGIWRNLCPLGIVSLIPHHFEFSGKKRLSMKQQGNLQLTGVLLLFTLVPLRHICFNKSGILCAGFLILAGVIAFVLGTLYDWKSAWCSGVCPVHPVEKLYGTKVTWMPANAHCTSCRNCVLPCPDSTIKPFDHSGFKNLNKFAHHLLIGGLPGFIWGWFHVPDHTLQTITWNDAAYAYGIPFLGLLLTLSIYWLIKDHRRFNQELTVQVFAAASIITYYWYRLPALAGFGLFRGDGMLIDLSSFLPYWTVYLVQFSVTLFFAWWLVFRKTEPKQWSKRPPFQIR